MVIVSHILQGDVDMLTEAARWAGRNGPIIMLEVGSYLGASATVLLQAAPPGSHIDCVDLWAPSEQHRNDAHAPTMWDEFRSNMGGAMECGMLHAFRGPSCEWLGMLERKFYDLAFIDGDHSYAGTLTDLTLAWPLMKQGAIVLVHDCIDDGSGDDAPYRALRDFCALRGLKYSVTQPPDAHYMGEIEKP